LKKFLLIVFLQMVFFSCNREVKPTISFYYWKTVFKISNIEKQTIQNCQVRKLYVRYFDIDLDKNDLPFPKSPIHFKDSTTGFSIVPVIYIKNQVLLSKKNDSKDLAIKTNSFINQINSKNKINIEEIQIDCDWTLSSKQNYLDFITSIKKISGKKISATIRLHQIKYFKKTGFPKVDNAVLMYYNMGTIQLDSLNSIYDKSIADNYLQSLNKYPLQLDVALPIYSWGIQIRDGKVIKLISKINEEKLKKDANFVFVKKNHYKAKEANFKAGNFYQKNDILKIESISKNDLIEMANDLNKNIKTKPREIIFYDLDEFNIKQYENDIFTQVTNQF
jgi:hypothetical protein